MAKIVVLGEVLIDFFPSGNVSPKSSATFARHLGGAPANVAVGLRRLGHETSLVSRVGDDPFGEFITGTLAAEKVDTSHLGVEHYAHTALAFVIRGERGEREFVFYRRPCADEFLSPEDIPRELIASSQGFHFGSLSLTVDPARNATWEALRYARDAGVTISMDPNVRLSLWDSPQEARALILQAAESCDLLKLSHEEAQFLTGSPDVDQAAQQLARRGPSTVVITTASGCRFQHRGYGGSEQGFTVEPKDTTGAGDAFMSGLLSWLLHAGVTELALLEPDMLRRGLRFAHAAGALVTTEIGALPSGLSLTTVEEFARSQR